MEQSTSLCDLTFLIKFTKGDNNKIAQYIRTYLRTSERIFQELNSASAQVNREDLYVKAHTVKPQVQYMGIKSLQEVLIKIEELAKADGEAATLKELVSKAMHLYGNSRRELEDKLAELEAGA